MRHKPPPLPSPPVPSPPPSTPSPPVLSHFLSSPPLHTRTRPLPLLFPCFYYAIKYKLIRWFIPGLAVRKQQVAVDVYTRPVCVFSRLSRRLPSCFKVLLSPRCRHPEISAGLTLITLIYSALFIHTTALHLRVINTRNGALSLTSNRFPELDLERRLLLGSALCEFGISKKIIFSLQAVFVYRVKQESASTGFHILSFIITALPTAWTTLCAC